MPETSVIDPVSDREEFLEKLSPLQKEALKLLIDQPKPLNRIELTDLLESNLSMPTEGFNLSQFIGDMVTQGYIVQEHAIDLAREGKIDLDEAKKLHHYYRISGPVKLYFR